MLNVNFDWWKDDYNAQVLDIERLNANKVVGNKENFSLILSNRDAIGIVALQGDAVLGFMVYSLYPKSLSLLTLQVKPGWQRQGIGSKMMAELKDKVHYGSRRSISVVLRETDLDSQLFFKKNGFLGISVQKEHYSDTKEDGFLMYYRAPQTFTIEKRANIDSAIQNTSVFTL